MQGDALPRLGFRFGANGPHAARTMMLTELRLLLAHTDAVTSRGDYARAIVEHNILGKPTRKARELTLRHLSNLYSLDTSNPIFRAMRRLWPLAESAQPVLALAVALARDPLLRATRDLVLSQPVGGVLTRERFEEFLSRAYPGRFSQASLKSFAQNVAGTWTAAGLLRGHVRKVRAPLGGQPESIALLLFLGYLEGRTGERLFSSDWTKLVAATPGELEASAKAAAHRGLLVFMGAGGVKELRFPGYLTTDEERIRQEVSHVV